MLGRVLQKGEFVVVNIKATKKDIIWNYVGTIVSLGSSFILVPILLLFLDANEYGLWNVFVSVGGITVLFDFGFNSVFSRNIAYCWSGCRTLKKDSVEQFEGDSEVDSNLLNKLIKACQLIYLSISLIAMIVLMSGGSAYIYYISESASLDNAIRAWLIYVLGVFFNLLYGYYDSALRGVGLVGEVNIARTIAKMVQLLLSVLLLLIGFGLTGVSIAYVCYGILFRIICKRKFYAYKSIGKLLKNARRPDRKDLLELFGTIWYSTWREGVVSVANYISGQVTTILCSFYLGLAETGRYGLAVQLSTAIGQIAVSFYSAHQPAMQQAYIKRDTLRVREMLSVGICIFEVLFPMGVIAIILVFLPIFQIIRPDAVISIPVMISVSAYQFIIMKRDCYAWYLAGTNRMVYYKSFIFSAVICVLISILLAEFFSLGIFGFVIAQIGSQLIYNAWHWQKIVDKELDLKLIIKWEIFVGSVKMRFAKKERNLI